MSEIRWNAGDHYPTTPVQCFCGWRETEPGAGTWLQHMGAAAVADALAPVRALDLDSIMADYVGPPIPHEAIAIVLDLVDARLRAVLAAEGGES